MTMTLATLLAALPNAVVSGPTDVPVAAVVDDSRRAGPGSVFVAIPGFTVDGHQYVARAAAQGARAVVVVDTWACPPDWDTLRCTVVAVPDTRVALSALAAGWYGFPGRALHVIGVTGTDGKTTTSYMLAALLDGGGRSSGLIGTVQFKIGPRWEENDTRQTTVEAPDVQALLARMRDGGVTHAVVESTSHGLALHKLDDCAFDVAVVTNITADHLDFHLTRDAYIDAKARLFDLAGTTPGKTGPTLAVLNADDPEIAARLRPHCRASVATYSMSDPAADMAGTVIDARADGSRVQVRGRFGAGEFWVPMPGSFNVANALAAVTVARGYDVPFDDIAARFAAFGGVPGRMETVRRGQPFTVIVDYAHTGYSFRKLLAVLRPLTAGRLIAVFGSAGERAPERRVGMGTVAAEGTDFAVLANEDPRGEDPDQIIDDIARTMLAAGRVEGRDFQRVPDRRLAIRTALELARPGDVVVCAGKGHECSILMADGKLPWHERTVTEEELARLGYAG